jgi:Zn-dependent protease
MRWSWKIATIRGVEIRVHAAFLLPISWIGVATWIDVGPWEALASVGVMLLLFTFVVLHELGHALTAAHYGCRTRDITLLPIGGVARLERMPDEPRAEMLIALAGPAVNVVLAALFLAIATIADVPLTPAGLEAFDEVPILARLVWMNVALAGFNLIPAFPMDGGRVLRAALALRLDRRRATHIAVTVGRAFALALGIIGFYASPMLAIVAVFVWFGASAEAGVEDLRAALRGMSVGDATARNIEVVAPGDALADVSRHVVSGFQNHFPVVEQDAVIGMLSHTDLLRGLTELGPTARVDAAMQTEVAPVDVALPLDAALEQLQRESSPALPVVDRGRLVGILTLENLGELLAMTTAVEHNRTMTERRAALAFPWPLPLPRPERNSSR